MRKPGPIGNKVSKCFVEYRKSEIYFQGGAESRHSQVLKQAKTEGEKQKGT